MESFEQFGKARFVFSQGGDVAGEDGDAVDLVRTGHSVRGAIEIMDVALIAESNLEDSGPGAAFEETGHGTLHHFRTIACGFLDEVAQRFADDLLKGQTNQIRETAIYGTDFAFEGERHQNVIEGINEIAVALLGARDNFEELIQLLVARRGRITLFDTPHQPAKLGNFLGTLPGVKTEQRYKNDEANG